MEGNKRAHSGEASVPLLADDSQIGANLRVCADGEDRADFDQRSLFWRARIVLLASDGLTAERITAAVGKSLLTLRRWRRRYVAKGVNGLLKDATRASRVKPLTPEKIN
jgi:hypothetical protein